MLASLVLANLAFADPAEMTAKVVALTPTLITVQKGTELWDIKCGAGTSTTVTGDLQVGTTVTISYDGPDAQMREAPGNVPAPTAPE